MLNISIEQTDDVLYCRVTGSNSVQNVIHYLNELHAAMEKYALRKVLIEENLSGKSLSIVEMFHVIRTANKTILSLPHQIAYVDINPEHNHDNLKFAETAAFNRWINMRLFSTVDNAEKWLQQ